MRGIVAAKYPQWAAAGFIQRVTVHYINPAMMSVEILIGSSIGGGSSSNNNGGDMVEGIPPFVDVKRIANDIKVDEDVGRSVFIYR